MYTYWAHKPKRHPEAFLIMIVILDTTMSCDLQSVGLFMLKNRAVTGIGMNDDR